MRELLVSVDVSLWSQVSVVVFGTCFLVLLCWVYLPARKKFYNEHSRLPLDTD